MDSNTSIHNFAQVARDFCHWAETAPLNPSDDITKGLLLLPKLYTVALQLPPASRSDTEYPALSSEELRPVMRRFAELPDADYSAFCDPFVFPPVETYVGWISDELADIYRDLKEGFSAYEANQLEDAAWIWKFQFKYHWGEHLVNVQWALHRRAVDKYLWPDF